MHAKCYYLGDGYQTGAMAPQFLIGKYRRFEVTDEVKKGRMRPSRCGLVSIRGEVRLAGKEWRLANLSHSGAGYHPPSFSFSYDITIFRLSCSWQQRWSPPIALPRAH